MTESRKRWIGLKKRLHEETGQVLVVTALCITVLLGLVAFAADVGVMLRAKRVMQTAADSAALAGAAEINFGDVIAAAQADAVQNNVPASAVTVNLGPQNGPNKNKLNYVEVIVSQSQPTFFMKMFNFSSLNVGARAVATAVPTSNCIYTLGTSGTDISMTGSGNLSISNCSILIDSTDANDALDLTGSGTITAMSIGIVGGFTAPPGHITPTPVTGMSAVSDPLSLTPPTFSSCNAGISFTGSTPHTVTGPSTPGGIICYNGFSNTGSGSVTFPAGTYVINGNFSTTGSGSLSGTGVTFYLPSNGDKFSVTGSGDLNFSAPTSGTYNGILFYQNPSDSTKMSITGSSSSSINGIFYAPSAQLDLTGSGGSAFNTDLIVGSLKITGSVGLTEYIPLAGVSPLSNPRLVE
jgi:Flp pilus assembly protein TadG